jgi:hypothetical protein
MDGGALKSKVVFLPVEAGSDLSVTMLYFEDSFGVVCKVPLRSSSHEGLCLVCFPQRKYTDCGSCVYNDITSADWFYEALNNSPATESGMLLIQPGCIFVGIGHFDDSSNTDHLMKSKLSASYPPNYDKFDTRALSIIWLLDVGVSTT